MDSAVLTAGGNGWEHLFGLLGDEIPYGIRLFIIAMVVRVPALCHAFFKCLGQTSFPSSVSQLFHVLALAFWASNLRKEISNGNSRFIKPKPL